MAAPLSLIGLSAQLRATSADTITEARDRRAMLRTTLGEQRALLADCNELKQVWQSEIEEYRRKLSLD